MKVMTKGLANPGSKCIMNQIFIAMGAILLGMIISCTVQAQDFYKANRRYFKERYHAQISKAEKECAILHRKRKVHHKVSLLAFRSRKPKFKPQAEVDGPRFGMVNQ